MSVPTYEYECQQCHRVFEIRQRITEPPLERCDSCGGTVRRLLSPAPFILKGEGWYVTDYPSESRKKAMESEKKTTTGSGSASTDTSSSSPATQPTTSGTTTGTPTTTGTTATSSSD